MKELVIWLCKHLGKTPIRKEMSSRINVVYQTPDGNVRKQAGGKFARGQHHYDPVLLLHREASFLKQLYGRHFPRLIDEGDGWITMTHCGSELSKNNLPKDWRNQVEEIAAALEKAKIIHRDIKPGNVMVLEGRLQLIDFGWAIAADESPYICPRELIKDVPHDHIYNNRVALESVVSSYEN